MCGGLCREMRREGVRTLLPRSLARFACATSPRRRAHRVMGIEEADDEGAEAADAADNFLPEADLVDDEMERERPARM